MVLCFWTILHFYLKEKHSGKEKLSLGWFAFLFINQGVLSCESYVFQILLTKWFLHKFRQGFTVFWITIKVLEIFFVGNKCHLVYIIYQVLFTPKILCRVPYIISLFTRISPAIPVSYPFGHLIVSYGFQPLTILEKLHLRCLTVF